MAPPKRRGLGRGLGALIPTDVSDLTRETSPAATPEFPALHAAMDQLERQRAERPTPPDVPEQFVVPREASLHGDAPKPKETLAAAEPGEQAKPVAAAEEDDELDLEPVPGAKFRFVPLDQILVNPKQPREVFDEDALEELKTSIREVGLLQPIVVRPYTQETEHGTLSRYELIMGERRLRASRAIGLDSIPAIVRETRDEDMLRDALLENIHRAQLNPLEEGAAYQQLLEEFGVTQEELSRRIGRSRPQISNTIRLLNLPGAVQRRVAAGVLTAGHARALLGLGLAEQQEHLAKRIVAEGLSVRTTEEIVQDLTAVASPEEVTDPVTGKRKVKAHAPGVEELSNRLADHFDTRVKVNLGQRKGRIMIEFATVADLERIIGVMGMKPKNED
ncbi:ParB/RepB/Spo0J family partition protein [Phytomonospora sp. NPDC050363]|uniref:ParB/RepB/Spo0J family partition protein n=1 Tax=Phytomonospora sp. NPDC050363 TaxID=3155642 RepID=UPI0033C5C43E